MLFAHGPYILTTQRDNPGSALTLLQSWHEVSFKWQGWKEGVIAILSLVFLIGLVYTYRGQAIPRVASKSFLDGYWVHHTGAESGTITSTFCPLYYLSSLLKSCLGWIWLAWVSKSLHLTCSEVVWSGPEALIQPVLKFQRHSLRKDNPRSSSSRQSSSATAGSEVHCRGLHAWRSPTRLQGHSRALPHWVSHPICISGMVSILRRWLSQDWVVLESDLNVVFMLGY